MNQRVNKLLAMMDDAGIESVILTDSKNMHYYSGFYNGEGYVIIGKSGFYVVTDSRYTEYAQSVCEGFEVADISRHKPSDFADKNAVVGFEDKSISYEKHRAISKEFQKFVPIGNMALSPREIKDEAEIKSIKKAVEIGDKAFSHICSYIREGMTELEVASEIDCFMKKNGAQEIAFPTIVATGARGSLPHAIPSDKTLQSGDLVVMDFGCKIDGYCGDMTRTVAVKDISTESKKVYDKVLEAQLAAIAAIRAGQTGCEIDMVARDILDIAYLGSFGHALGHSVGLDIHEAPNFSPRNKNAIEAGNVITVEPGVYLPGFCGVRTEDIVVVGETSCDILTESKKELVIVG